jgi:hypothetical protein
MDFNCHFGKEIGVLELKEMMQVLGSQYEGKSRPKLAELEKVTVPINPGNHR